MGERPHGDASSSVDRLSDAVIAYLDERPNSMDTLDGIASFWLSAAEPLDRRELARAIDALVASGRLERVSTAGIEQYRLAR